MKLTRLTAGGFGVLSGRTIELGGRSTVLYGVNETGKTSFIDSLLDALYGERPKGKLDAVKRAWIARYGDNPAPSKAELVTTAGAALVSTTAQHEGRALAEPSLARAVLFLRAGETALAETLDFLSAFIARVSGGGTVSIDDAVDQLATFAGKTGASRMVKLEAYYRDRIASFAVRLSLAGELEAVASQEAQAQTELTTIATDLIRERANLDAVAKERARREMTQLEVRLAALKQSVETGASAQAFDKALHAQARDCEKNRADAVAAASLARALGAKAAEGVADQRRLRQAAFDEQARLPLGDKRSLLRSRLEDLKLAAQAAPSGGEDQRGILRAAFAALGILVVGGILWFATSKVGAATVGALVGALVGWFLGSLVGGAKPGAAPDTRDAMVRLRGAIDDMGEAWRGIPPEEAERRLSEVERRLESLSLQIKQIETQFASESAAQDLHNSELRASEEKSLEQERQVADLLRRLGVANMEECSRRALLLERAVAELDGAVRGAEKEFNLPAGTPEAVQIHLRQRIDQLRENSDGADPALGKLGDAALDERARSAQKQMVNLEAKREGHQSRLRDFREKIGSIREGIGGSLVEVMRDKLRCEACLDDLKSWRQAAALAKEGLEAFSSDIAGQIRDCVAKAGPLFSAMSEGRYKGLRLKPGSTLDDQGLEVEHAVHSWKPFPWMSTGACDLLWLALRVSFARQAFPDPAFLVLDEPFHTLDSGRAASALNSLTKSSESQGWQLIILTKDERLAESFVAAGLSRIDLTV